MPSNRSLKQVKRIAQLFFLCLLFATQGLMAAEIRYVSDQIVLKMYKDSALSQKLPSLKSGDRLKLLKHDDGYAHIQLGDGTKGWVKSYYLVKDKPSIAKLEEVQEELDSLRSKHTDLLLEQKVPAPLPDNSLLERAETAESAREGLQKRINELQSQNTRQVDELRQLQELRNQDEKKDSSKTLILWIVLPILTLITGFFIGFKYLEAKIKTRFGGYNPI